MSIHNTADPVTMTVFNEIGIIEQLARTRLQRALPGELQVSHFSVLNHLARLEAEKSPAQLARTFQVTKGAMTNTVQRLEAAGYVRVRPDEIDGRKKLVAITETGKQILNAALIAAAPVFADVREKLGADMFRQMLPMLRDIRTTLDDTL